SRALKISTGSIVEEAIKQPAPVVIRTNNRTSGLVRLTKSISRAGGWERGASSLFVWVPNRWPSCLIKIKCAVVLLENRSLHSIPSLRKLIITPSAPAFVQPAGG